MFFRNTNRRIVKLPQALMHSERRSLVRWVSRDSRYLPSRCSALRSNARTRLIPIPFIGAVIINYCHHKATRHRIADFRSSCIVYIVLKRNFQKGRASLQVCTAHRRVRRYLFGISLDNNSTTRPAISPARICPGQRR